MADNTTLKVVFDLQDDDLKTLPIRLEKNASKAIRQTTLLVEGKAVRYAPRLTGNLKSTGTSSMSGSGFDTVGRAYFTAPYAIYVHEGTGIFGPKQQPITFTTKGKNPIEASIRGMPGRPFLKRAAEEEVPKLKDRIFR